MPIAQYIFIFLMLFVTSPLWAATYYVASAPTGSDARSCATAQSALTPKATLASVWTCLTSGAGDTLHIKGNLTETFNAPSLKTGTPSAYTTIEGDGVSSTTLTGHFYIGDATTYMIFQDFTINNNNNIDDTLVPGSLAGHHIIIRRMHITNARGQGILAPTSFTTVQDTEIDLTGLTGSNGAHGMYFQGTDNLVERNYVHDIRGDGYCIQAVHDGSGGKTDRTIIRQNRCLSSTTSGISSDGDDSQIYRNIVSGVNIHGIVCGYGTCLRTKIYHNVIYNNGGAGILLAFGGATNVEVRNNLVTANGSAEFANNSGATGVVVANNACTTSEACGTSPLFITNIQSCTNPPPDFTLKASDSLCANAGAIISGFSTLTAGQPGTYNGSAPDIGYLESGADTTPPAAPTGLIVE
jgi:hypothetical protein